MMNRDHSPIDRLLMQVEKRLRLQRAIVLALRGAAAGCAAGAALALASRALPLMPSATTILVALGWLGSAVLVGFGWAWLARQPAWETARLCDARLGLKERLATALEVRAGRVQSGLAAAQLADAEQIAGQVRPAEAAPLRLPRRTAALGAALAAVLLSVLVLPNPLDALLREREAVRRAVAEERQKIEQVKQQVAIRGDLAADARRQELARSLNDLLRELERGGLSREEALARLSTTEERLARTLDRGAPGQRAALQSLERNLSSLSAAGQRSQEGAGSASQDLAKRAEQIDRLSESERAALASALQQAGEALQAANPSLGGKLGQAARALRSGGDATSALREAADDLAQAEAEQATQADVERVLASLQAGKQTIARAGREGSGTAARQGGTGTSGQQGQGPGASAASGQNQGQAAAGNMQASGPVAGAKPGKTAGGQATGSGRPLDDRPGSEQTGAYEQVYAPTEPLGARGKPEFLPGQQGGEGNVERQQVTTRPLAAGVARPYTEVYQQYRQAAVSALEGSYVPVSLKDYVREYFSALEPGP